MSSKSSHSTKEGYELSELGGEVSCIKISGIGSEADEEAAVEEGADVIIGEGSGVGIGVVIGSRGEGILVG